MAINKGYLTCDTTIKGDEVYTPFYAVEPLLEFVPKDKIIWCPFDEDWSSFVQLFRENGYKVINSNLKNNQDFFTYEPKEHYDIIISNPPFSKKDKVIERVYKLNKPFCLLLPLPALQSINRFKYFKQGCEVLIFDKRVNYHTCGDFKNFKKGNHFASIYICRDVLPEKLIFRELHSYDRELKNE